MFLIIGKSTIGKLGNLFMAENFFINKTITKVEEKCVIGNQFRNFPISKFQNL
jgi:hypothetical protein